MKGKGGEELRGRENWNRGALLLRKGRWKRKGKDKAGKRKEREGEEREGIPKDWMTTPF